MRLAEFFVPQVEEHKLKHRVILSRVVCIYSIYFILDSTFLRKMIYKNLILKYMSNPDLFGNHRHRIRK